MNLIVALVIASLVYIVQKRLYAKWWNRNLDVTISFEDTCVREGDASALTEVIYNGKFLPLPANCSVRWKRQKRPPFWC